MILHILMERPDLGVCITVFEVIVIVIDEQTENG